MQANQLALSAGRSLQKKQTGLVHFCAQTDDSNVHDTIPILENALFALSLFRSRLSDNVLEGRGIIEKILAFEVDGNFPIYLHDYPAVKDTHLSLHLLPIFYWLTIDFAHVMGTLKPKLEILIQKILDQAEGKELPGWAQMRIRAMKGELGPDPQTLFEWGMGLISLQLAEKKGADISRLIEKAATLWHGGLCLYVGPAQSRHQAGYTPELNLFELFMCQWQGNFPKRAESFHPVQLKGALIRPIKVKPQFQQMDEPLVHFNPSEDCPLFIAWQDHTFVLAKKRSLISGEFNGSEGEFLIQIPEDDEMGLNFYLDHHVDHEILVEGERATTFRSGEKLQLKSKGLHLTLSFEEEDGKYFGHLMRGNRPSQHLCRGENHFTSYDYRIAIRTVKTGKSPIRVRVNLEQASVNPQPLPLSASHYPHTESCQ